MTPSRSPDGTVDRPENPLRDPESPQELLESTPIPRMQLLSVCVARVSEPIAYTQIFPYVNQMVWDLGVTDNPKKVGFYSGLVDSSFAFAQLFTIYSYGALSDRIGRKPVILLGTFGVALSAALFGLSNSFVHMVLSRTVAGLLSGYVAVLHSVLGEITDTTNQAAAYPIYGLCYPIGSLIGPLLGGALVNPNENIPHLIPSFLRGIFAKYPYMLPSMTTCLIATTSFIFTLPLKVGRKTLDSSGTSTPNSLYGTRGRTCERGSSQGASTNNAPEPERSRHSSVSTRVGEDLPPKCVNETDALLGGEEEEPHNWTARELLKLPHLWRLYRSSMILSFLAESFVVVFVLFAYTEIQYGGLGFQPAEIGFVLTTAGIISFALQILVLPYLLRQCKPAKVFETCMMLWPIGYAIPPILNGIARISSNNGEQPLSIQASAIIWVGIWTVQLLTKFACMAYA
ncbi:membrane protein [Ceratobasidium theobromae]|uniref:Membrane protein n=1 Tax=Ceratobasidium theobromae TaxID=1582974 RepID=A0A5N5QQR2_9AGAM|nr:membrane protein [Ceratobasidium theobromae]